jgi:hypothetical protein
MTDDTRKPDKTQKPLHRLIEEIVRLNPLKLDPAEYFGEFLIRILTALAAPAGAVYLLQPGGALKLIFQINFKLVCPTTGSTWQQHVCLIENVFRSSRAHCFAPGATLEIETPEVHRVVNPLPSFILLAPMEGIDRCMGLVEVIQDGGRSPGSQAGAFVFLQKMAQHASSYVQVRSLKKGLIV